MSKTLFRYSAVAIMGAAMLVTSGCGTRFWPWGRKPTINPNYEAANALATAKAADGWETVGGTGGTGAGGWGSTGEKLGPRFDGELVPIADRRWEGVAVYFAFDRSDLGTSEKPKLDALAAYMKENPDYCVIIEGNCDDRGSDEYNRGLGERRALAVRDYMVAAGVADSRMQTVSYGEEKPAVPSATTEEQHAKNRRAEFVVGTLRKGATTADVPK